MTETQVFIFSTGVIVGALLCCAGVLLAQHL